MPENAHIYRSGKTKFKTTGTVTNLHGNKPVFILPPHTHTKEDDKRSKRLIFGNQHSRWVWCKKKNANTKNNLSVWWRFRDVVSKTFSSLIKSFVVLAVCFLSLSCCMIMFLPFSLDAFLC